MHMYIILRARSLETQKSYGLMVMISRSQYELFSEMVLSSILSTTMLTVFAFVPFWEVV